jgi:hypothetical protein
MVSIVSIVSIVSLVSILYVVPPLSVLGVAFKDFLFFAHYSQEGLLSLRFFNETKATPSVVSFAFSYQEHNIFLSNFL